VAKDTTGHTRHYGAPDDSPQFKKLFDAIDAVRSHAPVVCGPEAATAQTLAVNGMHESVTVPNAFPDAVTVSDDEAGRRWVPGLDEVLRQCYQRHQLPAETGVGWARGGGRVDLHGYDCFPRGGRDSTDGRG
jgi:hypothetical protein